MPGLGATLRRPVERRGLSQAGADLIELASHVENHVLDVIVGIVLGKLMRGVRGRRREQRRVAIFGPDGEVLQQVTVPDKATPNNADER